MDKAADHITPINANGATGFEWVDIFGRGPTSIVEWSSSLTPTGVMGQPTLATAEKGQRILEEAVSQLIAFVDYFRQRPALSRVAHHDEPTSSPLPRF